MLKRITSISIVLIMAISMAAPILHLDCDMPCCEVQEMTCCDKKMDTEITKACKVEMKTCDMGSIFVPLISAPLNKYNMKVEMNVQGTIQCSTFISSYNIVFFSFCLSLLKSLDIVINSYHNTYENVKNNKE